METTINLKSEKYSNSIQTATTKSKYELLIEKLDFSYFGLISITILVGSILGGITASIILNNHASIWQLIICSAVSMANNTAGIAQAPTKWVCNLFIITLIVNILLILINVF